MSSGYLASITKLQVKEGFVDLQIPDDAQHGPPLDRARVAGQLIEQVMTVSNELSRLRREAIEEAIASGKTKAQVARELGLDPSRISRIVATGTPPERALLSPDGQQVTIALGSKLAQVGDGSPNDMISRDAAEAYDTLRTALGHWGVACTREIVPAPGLVDLNRDRLIVLGSPKVLPVVGQIMGSDPHLAFGADDQGRYLMDRDTDTIYRSPQDAGEHTDYAYVGRLPRPDGKGHFLWLAGIHAAGTLGAARYTVDNAPELYRMVKDRLFSVLVATDYEADSHAITSTKPLTKTFLR